MPGRITPITFVALALGSIGLLLLPILSNPIPPLGDYAGHLSRVYVFHNLIHGTAFTDWFAYRVAIIPNLAIDVFGLALMELGVGIETAGRIYLVLTILAMCAGVLALHYVNFRRLSIWPLIALPFFYHEMFFGGLLNYFLGVGFAFVGAAVWEVQKRRSPRLAILGLFGFSLLLFFCHGVADLLFIGLVVGTEISERFTAGPLGERAAPGAVLRYLAIVLACCLPFGLLLLSPLTHGTERPDLSAFAFRFTIAGLQERFMLLRTFAWGYDNLVDRASMIALVVIGGVALVSGRLRLDRRRLLPIAGLIGVILIAPDFWFGAFFLPNRLPIAVFMLVVAATDVVPARRSELGALTAAIVVLTVVRGTVVERNWLAANAMFSPLMQALDALPPGSRIYTAVASPDSRSVPRTQVASLPNYAVMRHNLYFSGTAALPTQNLVYRLPPYDKADPVPLYLVGQVSKYLQPDEPYTAQEMDLYDYALIVSPDLWPVRPPSQLEPILQTPDYALYRIPHPPATR